MKITTKEIAEACGVSRGTVDRALNDRPGINEGTKRLIKETAERLGYRPDFLARSLAKGRTMTLGLVLFDVHNRFFAELANSIEIRARERGYFLYLTLTDKKSHVERQCIEHLVERKVDGLILCSAIKEEGYAEYLKKMNIPIIAVGNRISPDIPFVGINDYQAMADAVEFAICMGYEDITYVSPPLAYDNVSNIYAQKQRYLGFVDAVRESKKNIQFRVLDNRNFLRDIDRTCKGTKTKSAVLCSSDVFALEVLREFRLKGYRVPEDIGVMGFDSIDFLKYVEPKLTTVSYPIEEIGTQSVENIIGKIEGKNINDIILEHRLVKGNSL